MPVLRLLTFGGLCALLSVPFETYAKTFAMDNTEKEDKKDSSAQETAPGQAGESATAENGGEETATGAQAGNDAAAGVQAGNDAAAGEQAGGPAEDGNAGAAGADPRDAEIAALKKSLKEENVELGRGMIEKECTRRGVRMSDIVKPEYYEPILKRTGFTDFDDICSAVGYGGMAAVYVVTRLIEESKAKEQTAVQNVQTVDDMVSEEKRLSQHRAHHGIVLTGSEDLDIPVRFAKCCSPVPGDEIVGYITRGRGVTIHKAECVNAAAGEDERKVAVEWAMDGEGTFSATITILAYDRVNMLGEIATIIGENGVSIRAASIQSSGKTRISTLRLTLDVRTREEMDRVINALRNKSDILDVYRTTT
jgi:(p)ppGpp synthase/HD superfamily hydrolase